MLINLEYLYIGRERRIRIWGKRRREEKKQGKRRERSRLTNCVADSFSPETKWRNSDLGAIIGVIGHAICASSSHSPRWFLLCSTARRECGEEVICRASPSYPLTISENLTGVTLITPESCWNDPRYILIATERQAVIIPLFDRNETRRPRSVDHE